MNLPPDCVSLENVLLNSYSFGGYDFPQNTTTSLPVLKHKNGQIFTSHFLYINNIDENDCFSRPFAWAMFPLHGGAEHLISWCAAQDFISTADYPLNSLISARLPWEDNGLNPAEVSQYYKEINELFLEISEFAFADDLNAVQVEMLSRYRELFMLFCHQGLYPYYQALAPEFFSWLGLILVTPKDEPTEYSANDTANALARLSSLFEDKILNDTHKEELFDQLHLELQQYKGGAYEELEMTTLRDVILVIDSMQKSLELTKDNKPTPSGYQRLKGTFQGVEQDLVDLLYRHGVDPYRVEGDIIEIPRQKVLATMPTSDPELDKTVAKRLNQGWLKGRTILRPEYIKGYIYKENSKENLDSSEEDLKEMSDDE